MDKRQKRRRRKYKQRKKYKRIRIQKRIVTAVSVLILIAAAVLLTRRKQDSELINSTCESYRSDVEQEAAKYDMSDYVDLILALMMQESSGIGPDVLQSSEGEYNTLYPQEPNGITDVDYSISCGIQELKYSMEKARVRNPKDLKRIRLALQGYNFGADIYFAYMEKHGKSEWSRESAEDFAKIASNETLRSEDDPLRDAAGPWDYGDQRYPEHVLRYYHP